MVKNAAQRLLAVAEVLATVDPELSRAASERVLRSCGGRCQPGALPAALPPHMVEDEARRTRLECARHAVSGASAASSSAAVAGRVCRVCAAVLVPGVTCAVRVRAVRQLGRRAAGRLLQRYRLRAPRKRRHQQHQQKGPVPSSSAEAVQTASWFEGALDKSRVTKGVPAALAGATVVCARRPDTCVVLHCFRCGQRSVVALGRRPHIERPPAPTRPKAFQKKVAPAAAAKQGKKTAAPATSAPAPAAEPFSFRDIVARGPPKRPAPPQPTAQTKKQQQQQQQQQRRPQTQPPPAKQRKTRNAALAFLQPSAAAAEPETGSGGTGLFSFLDELRKK